MADVNFLADGIAARKQRASEHVVDDANLWRGRIIGRRKFPSGYQRNSQSSHIAGTHEIGKRRRLVSLPGRFTGVPTVVHLHRRR